MADQLITVDGGPHTLWWPTQSPNGTFLQWDVPPPQILREMQPNAKFLITGGYGCSALFCAALRCTLLY
jgi:hypothetical protein